MIQPIEKVQIPYQFEYEHDDFLFTLEIHYNPEYDFFTIDLYKNDELIVYGEKLVYGQQLFKSLNDSTLPKLIPLDESENTDKITYDNFQKIVFLKVIEDAV